MIQSQTSFNTASLRVKDAINNLLSILLMMFLNVGIWVLGVGGVLTFEERAGDVGVQMWVGLGMRVALGEFKV